MLAVCIQEVFAGDFPTSPTDQQYTYDGPVGSGGREAAFLVRAVVCGSPVPRVADSTTILMQGCHRRPVSVFGGILSLLLSV